MHHRPKTVDPHTEIRENVVALRQEGRSYSEIGKILGFSAAKAWSIADSAGITFQYLVPIEYLPLIREKINQGLSSAQIGRLIGYSEHSVKRFVLQHAIPRPPVPSLKGVETEEVLALWKSGKTQSEIAQVFGVSQPTVSYFLVSSGHRCMNRPKKEKTNATKTN